MGPCYLQEEITFDVDIPYPYNAIFGRGFNNKFEAAIRPGYLSMKIPCPIGIITTVRSKKGRRQCFSSSETCASNRRKYSSPSATARKQELFYEIRGFRFRNPGFHIMLPNKKSKLIYNYLLNNCIP
jgi:hypothetical protein